MKSAVLILAALACLAMASLAMTGCARHAPAPALLPRHCAAGSWPVQAMYHGEVVDVCAVIDPACAKTQHRCPVVDVIPVGAVNTYLDPDADEAAEDKATARKRPWWQFWGKQQNGSGNNS